MPTGAKRGIKTYVCGPMTGHKWNNFPAFSEVSDWLSWEHERSIVTPCLRQYYLDKEYTHQQYLNRDIYWMLECERVAVLPNWENSIGCKSEIYVAHICGLKIEQVMMSKKNGSLYDLRLIEFDLTKIPTLVLA